MSDEANILQFTKKRPRYTTRHKSGYVYLIQAKNSSRYKIGLSENPELRLKRLELMSPLALTLIGSYPCERMMEEEREWHERLKDYRIHGEWFELPPKRALLTLCEFFVREVKVIVKEMRADGEPESEIRRVGQEAFQALIELFEKAGVKPQLLIDALDAHLANAG